MLPLIGLDFLHRHVEAAIRSTVPGEDVMLTFSDLEDPIGNVAREAYHAKRERIKNILSGLFDKIEGMLA
jgi:hypothetical protein